MGGFSQQSRWLGRLRGGGRREPGNAQELKEGSSAREGALVGEESKHPEQPVTWALESGFCTRHWEPLDVFKGVRDLPESHY